MTADDPREVLTRQARPPDATVRYGPLPEHVADVRWPQPPDAPTDGPTDAPTANSSTDGSTDDGPAPLALVIHGGFWRVALDRHHTAAQCEGLAAEGFAVAAIEFRRTGQDGGGWPGTFEDVGAAVDAVPGLVAQAATAAGTSVDADRTVLVGHSAGGHLAAWALTTSRPHVVGGVTLAGVLDLHTAQALRLSPGPRGPAVEELLGGGPDDVPDRYAAADPTRSAPPSVPVEVLHGTADTTVPPELSQAYADATGAHLELLDGIEHFGLIDPRSPAWPMVVAAVRRAAGAAGR